MANPDGLRKLVLALGLAMLGAGAAPGQVIDGYREYTDWRGWARLQAGYRAGLASSWDRAEGNQDYSQYEYPEGLRRDEVVATVQTIAGPGIIHRFYMPHLTAKQQFAVRMYFDGETTARIDTDSTAVLSGAFSYFSAPLVTTFAGGQVCYEPIPFASSVRIETVNHVLPADGSWSRDFHYYQYSYRTFPAGTQVETYTGTLSPAQQASRTAAAAVLAGGGQHPAGESPTAVRVITAGQIIPAGGALVLAQVAGSGLLRRLNVRMDAATDAELDALRLRVLYDGNETGAIDVPVALFFGAGHGRVRYKSLPLGTDSADGFYCYWPMPFHRSVRIELANSAAAGISVDSGLVEYEPGPVGPDLGYLHARTSRSVFAAGQIFHTLLNTSGQGHYVGSLAYLRQPTQSFAMLEGDDIITVDGTNVLHGTGLEDGYNGGYYFNWVGAQADEPEGTMPSSAIRPLCGILHVSKGTAETRADPYRWLIADRVPFSSSIEVKIENRYCLVGAEWNTVAFWYQLPPVPADFDGDWDVDQADYELFEACASGPGIPLAAGCEGKDLDTDGDVDESDFGVCQRCYSGDDNPADPGCAD